ncbi:hypothetical protein N7501_002716 [Penicillium viridicatum]|nr:hypothetical protein N7501_002716 [Penicillium viridicatum]
MGINISLTDAGKRKRDTQSDWKQDMIEAAADAEAVIELQDAEPARPPVPVAVVVASLAIFPPDISRKVD